jgi:hypothetical protein
MEKRMENARICLAQGADAVRTAGETAKQLGLRFIPSLRMNDAHFMSDPDGHATCWINDRLVVGPARVYLVQEWARRRAAGGWTFATVRAGALAEAVHGVSIGA